MCGISGLFSTSKKLVPSECIQFIDALAHRGPDGRGTYFDPDCNLFLGHRRLKILDLSDAGIQPMHSADGRYIVVFNGEIYNFLELKNELSQKGYSFRSQSDTEVILAAFHEWGEECQLKFNGMWAFAIWDTREKTLFLSRDRFGVKPLYICQKNGYFAFASEIKAFGALPFISLELNDQRIADTIEDPLCLEPTSETIFEGIQKIPPGCSLTLSRNGVKNIRRWWNTLSHLVEPPESEEQRINTFRDLFFDACSVRMRSDVSIGTALSGGLDSSSILSSIFRLSQTSHLRWPDSWQKSFTAVFPNSSHDELAYAQIASRQTKADSFFYPITSDDLIRHLDDAMYSIEDVFDPPIGPWLLYREYRKQGVTISIDGHGADELLCGYHHQFERACLESMFPFPRIGRVRTLWPLMKQMHAMSSDQKTSDILLKLMKNGAQTFFHGSFLYPALKKLYWGRMGDESGHGRYGWLQLKPASYDFAFERAQSSKEFKRLSSLNQLLYLDFHYRTLPTILRNFDRCSMAHGVEIRAPFMDWRLVTYAFSLPSTAKVGAMGSKSILRKAMQGILPEEIRLRKSKIGFAGPLNQWITNDLRPYILDVVHSRQFQESSIWDGPKIARDLEKMIALKDYVSLRKVWEFVLADRLKTVFRKQRVLSGTS